MHRKNECVEAREVANSSIQPDMSEQDGDDAVADLMGKMTLEAETRQQYYDILVALVQVM